ncbi:MAG TPA: YdcF family protein [Acidimicrobiales bacterium]|nr:YdcF family protein [Acidimicrobiales bacterium]
MPAVGAGGARTAFRPSRRLVLRALGALLGLVVLYVGVTFGQVYRASRHDGARPADAIVVLGAAQYDGRPSLVFRDRLDHARSLYEAGYASRIVVTGGRQEGDRFTEAAAGYQYLRDQGVPDGALLREVAGTNTYESLQEAAEFLVGEGLTSVVLVTDGYHAYRVRAVAEELGLDAAVSPARGRLSRPSELRQLLRETAAVSVGRLIGWNRLFRIDARVNS